MIIDEKDSGKHWCCQDTDMRCTGNRCMGWRFEQKPNPDWKPQQVFFSAGGAGDTRSDPQPYIPDETRGYCGLAGRP